MDPVVIGALESRFDLIPICPEVDCGMGTPREPMRLQGNITAPRLVTLTSRIDKTDQMDRWSQTRIAEMKQEKIAGFVFKSGSPTCGLSVNIYDGNDNVVSKAAGIFARRFSARFSRRLIAEAEQLHDDSFREAFIQRILTFASK
jgi:uncharacterized protein YbbK (DUF523 family)